MKPLLKPAFEGRIQFIDALRAYAILMMLQGHFIYTLLDPVHRNSAHWLYSSWAFLRGTTAPIFFTVTGLVFVFLLLKDDRPLLENQRVRKGIRRGLMLIGIGYLLRLNIWGLLGGQLYSTFWAVDVLHCIGLSVLALLGLYAVHRQSRLPYPVLLAISGLSIFYFTLSLKAADWSFLPRAVENYFSHAQGSVFIFFPWVGYTLLGGVIGWHVHRRPGLYRTYWWPAVLFTLGMIIHFSSSQALMNLYELTGIQNFKDHAYNNYIIYRFGHVLVVFAVFMWLEKILKKFHPLFLKVGTETLTIYNIHYILLYGSGFGIGLARYWRGTLDPVTAAAGAMVFLSGFILFIAYIELIRAGWHNLYQNFRFRSAVPHSGWINYHRRRFQVMSKRRRRHWEVQFKSLNLVGWLQNRFQ